MNNVPGEEEQHIVLYNVFTANYGDFPIVPKNELERKRDVSQRFSILNLPSRDIDIKHFLFTEISPHTRLNTGFSGSFSIIFSTKIAIDD
jgi:hypothetical protein